MIYIACENANFVWRPTEVKEFDRLWREENMQDIQLLSQHFKRPASDVAFLIWDRIQNGFKDVPLSRSEADKMYAKRTKANAKRQEKKPKRGKRA